MEIRAKDFSNRMELDAHINALPDKTGAVIVGTSFELAQLQLSETTTVWGVPCKITMGDNE